MYTGDGVLVNVLSVVIDGDRGRASRPNKPLVVCPSSIHDNRSNLPETMKHLFPKILASCLSLCGGFLPFSGTVSGKTRPLNSFCHRSKSTANLPSESANSFTPRGGF